MLFMMLVSPDGCLFSAAITCHVGHAPYPPLGLYKFGVKQHQSRRHLSHQVRFKQVTKSGEPTGMNNSAMNEALDPMNNPALEAEQPSRWSDWSLHYTGLYYFRARSLPYEVAITVGANSRNTVIADGQGRFLHYHFLSINEASILQYASTHMTPVSTVQEAEPAPASIVEDSASTELPQQPLQAVKDEDEHTGKAVKADEAAAQATIIDIETSASGVKISFPCLSDDEHAIVLDKATRKYLKSKKNKQVSSKKKVSSWLES